VDQLGLSGAVWITAAGEMANKARTARAGNRFTMQPVSAPRTVTTDLQTQCRHKAFGGGGRALFNYLILLVSAEGLEPSTP
jgi:hypothetical protein